MLNRFIILGHGTVAIGIGPVSNVGTSRYTDFPPDSAKWLWTGLGGAAQPVMWQQAGYLQMK